MECHSLKLCLFVIHFWIGSLQKYAFLSGKVPSFCIGKYIFWGMMMNAFQSQTLQTGRCQSNPILLVHISWLAQLHPYSFLLLGLVKLSLSLGLLFPVWNVPPEFSMATSSLFQPQPCCPLVEVLPISPPVIFYFFALVFLIALTTTWCIIFLHVACLFLYKFFEGKDFVMFTFVSWTHKTMSGP